MTKTKEDVLMYKLEKHNVEHGKSYIDDTDVAYMAIYEAMDEWSAIRVYIRTKEYQETIEMLREEIRELRKSSTAF